MSDLTSFLLARIDEDEALARSAAATNIQTVAHEHIARWNPARVLAECEAKRRIVTEHPWDEYDICTSNDAMGSLSPIDACPVLRLLALPYAAHPDYREEWKP